jgi:hypothetical protein
MGEWIYGDPYFLDLPDRFTNVEKAVRILMIVGRVGPRAGFDDGEIRTFLILPGLELRLPCCPALSQ